jgi:hypothetical protein
MKEMDLPQRHRATESERPGIWMVRKKLWGNADRSENKGVGKIGIQKMLKTKQQKIDCLRDAVQVAERRRV